MSELPAPSIHDHGAPPSPVLNVVHAPSPAGSPPSPLSNPKQLHPLAFSATAWWFYSVAPSPLLPGVSPHGGSVMLQKQKQRGNDFEKPNQYSSDLTIDATDLPATDLYFLCFLDLNLFTKSGFVFIKS
ncbi:hypothetical protein U1Q18_018926 [Sarracenia purpurea var. burkii]